MIPMLARKVASAEVKGRLGRLKTPGAWLDDLMALGKALCLCDFCAHKVDMRPFSYARTQAVPGHSYCHGTCDGCQQWTATGLYQKRKDYHHGNRRPSQR